MADDLCEMVTSGKVSIRIGLHVDLGAIAQAHRAMEVRKTTGGTILKL